jgi:hypothetical protein
MSAGFVKSIAPRLVGKVVEIYQGSTHETVRYSEREIERKTIICGRLIEALEECLVLDVDNVGEVYINSWSVQTIVEIKNGCIFDIYNPDERKQTKR